MGKGARTPYLFVGFDLTLIAFLDRERARSSMHWQES
jgi:hypothetical protein